MHTRTLNRIGPPATSARVVRYTPMAQTRIFALICVGILAITVVGLVLLMVFVDLGLQLQGEVALVVGAVLTMALAMLLMGLVFLSNRSGHDQTVHLDSKDQ